MYKHILLPTDGSKLSAKAVKAGLRFARSIGARVTALNIAPEYRAQMGEGIVLPVTLALAKRFEEETAKRSNQLLEDVKAEAAAAGVEANGVTARGVPYEAIIKQAKKANCDLIMMASHGRKGLSSILFGSETAKVPTHSTIPVLVVR